VSTSRLSERVHALRTQLLDLIGARLGEEETLMVGGFNDPILHRCDLPFHLLSLLIQERLGGSEGLPWQPVARLERVIGPFVTQLEAMVGLPRWREATRLLQGGLAVNWASRLAEQVGAKLSCDVNYRTETPGIHAAVLNNVNEARNLAAETANALLKALFSAPKDGSRDIETATLTLHRQGSGAVQATWRTDSGKVLRHQSLDELIAERASTILESFVVKAEEMCGRHSSFRELAAHRLKAFCPELERVSERSAIERLAGYWMFSYQDSHGLPADVYLFLESPPEGNTQAHLCVHRAFEEFCLESPEGGLFYVGPGQVRCRVTFGNTANLWHVARPEIRIPAGLPRWVHLYTGEMRVDCFGQAPILNASCQPCEAVLPISAAARELVSNLVMPHSVPFARDLCIPAQDRVIGAIEQRVREQAARTGEIDVLGIVRRVIALGLQGITSGSKRNTSTPRTGWSTLPYLITNPKALEGKPLSKRVFRFSPVF
jgi:hypothetical protein